MYTLPSNWQWFIVFQTSRLPWCKPFHCSPARVQILFRPNSNSRFSLSLMVFTVICPLGAIICSRYKQVRSLIIVGFASFLIFSITMATSTVDNVTAYWGIQVFLGIGLGLVLCAIVTAAQLSAPPELMYVAVNPKRHSKDTDSLAVPSLAV